MTRWLFSLILLSSISLFSGETESQVAETSSIDESQHSVPLRLVDERLFELVSSGLANVNIKQVRAELIAIQANVEQLNKAQQAFYWFNLAVSSRLMTLASNEVIPHIQKALRFISDISQQQHFKILLKAIHLASDYQQYALLINYIEQLRTLTNNELDPASKRLPEEYENLKAWAYYQLGNFDEAEVYFNQLITEAQLKGTEHSKNWYVVLSAIYQNNKNVDKEIAILSKQYELFPNRNTKLHLDFLLNKL